MPNITTDPPLSLYIHLPWCVRKCPYCDFNSHRADKKIPQKEYVQSLIKDFEHDTDKIKGRQIESIFIGGGTPSLFSGENIAWLLNTIKSLVPITPQAEITLEVNPGTIDQQYFAQYHAAGVNRLSIGVQSFNDKHLTRLGRIHQHEEAADAIKLAQNSGFNNINIDIMYALPQQSMAEALADLSTAITYQSTHISWYQLTIEPNTVFYKRPPRLPNQDQVWELEQAGQQLLTQAGYQHYEVSAFSQATRECQHNLNYWTFGDYLGIGAGAHSKITNIGNNTVTRQVKVAQPTSYLDPEKNFISKQTSLTSTELIFEFMLNALRLRQAIPIKLFEQRTGLAAATLTEKIQQAVSQGLLDYNSETLRPTAYGRRFLNDLMEIFLG
ncbi:MAG: radical SAM family heme chaperone HemW [Gammaproteobacteria bacterium]